MDINLCLQGQVWRVAEHVLALRRKGGPGMAGGKVRGGTGRRLRGGAEEGEDLLQNMCVKIACAVKLLLTLK